jgi:serine/threonine protein phosphatase PrpC
VDCTPGRDRTRNEDCFVVVDVAERAILDGARAARSRMSDRVLLAVCDGLGGQPGGAIASSVVAETLARAMLWSRPEVRRDELMESAVHLAHRAVRQAAMLQGKLGMGATLVAALVQGDEAWVCEVGDSRAYLLRGEKIAQLSHDQSMVQAMVDEGLLHARDARSFPFRHVVLQSLGMNETPRVALRRVQLRRRDVLLLCSDGLTELVSDREIGAALLRRRSLDEACSKLVEMANARGGVDNVTVVAASVSGRLPAPSPSETIADTIDVLKAYP